MYCTNCGFKVNDEDNFCTNCGTEIRKSQTENKQLDQSKIEKVRSSPFVDTQKFNEIIEKGQLDEKKLDLIVENIEAVDKAMSIIKKPKVTINGKELELYKESEEEKKKRENIQTANYLTSSGINIPSFNSQYDFEEDEDDKN